MAEISEAIAMIKKAESDAEQLILDSESKSVDMVNESKINAENIINEAKKAAEEKQCRMLAFYGIYMFCGCKITRFHLKKGWHGVTK